LTVAATHSNRLLIEVIGPVENIQRALHVSFLTYRHPSEARDFFAPDTDPSVDARLAIADITGLNNYIRPRPKIHRRGASTPAQGPVPRTGSGSDGGYMGKDFRAAYLPGVSLAGAGQMVGLFELDGF
jgi:hypothetical protein